MSRLHKIPVVDFGFDFAFLGQSWNLKFPERWIDGYFLGAGGVGCRVGEGSSVGVG